LMLSEVDHGDLGMTTEPAQRNPSRLRENVACLQRVA
jgi:hypothetical protein